MDLENGNFTFLRPAGAAVVTAEYWHTDAQSTNWVLRSTDAENGIIALQDLEAAFDEALADRARFPALDALGCWVQKTCDVESVEPFPLEETPFLDYDMLEEFLTLSSGGQGAFRFGGRGRWLAMNEAASYKAVVALFSHDPYLLGSYGSDVLGRRLGDSDLVATFSTKQKGGLLLGLGLVEAVVRDAQGWDSTATILGFDQSEDFMDYTLMWN